MITMKKDSLLRVLGLLTFLGVAAAVVVLYAQGFRLDLGQRSLAKTGMLLVKSVPDGARVLLDGELRGATDSTLSSLKPGTYHLKIEKEGYLSWEKDVEVKEELVTKASALLPPLSPSLTAITQSGARLVTTAPSGAKAVFLSENKLFLLQLTSQFLGFLRTRPQEIALEPTGFPFPGITQLVFSPNEDQILALSPSKSILFPIGAGASSTVVADPTKLRADWQTLNQQQRAETVKTLELSGELMDLAVLGTSTWSPDERKFLYEKAVEGKREFWVVNLTDPLPVGEETNRKILETDNQALKLFWLASSQHFVVLEGDTVSLLDLDGTNQREIFKGTLGEPVALSSADLAQVIVLTSISSNAPVNLYGISLR